MNLINAIAQYLETQLNAINTNVVFDLGYLFERDSNNGYVVRQQKANSYTTEDTPYIPAMLQFKGDWNKPLNYTVSNQLAKSGTVLLWFSLPDRDTVDSDIPFTFEDVVTVLETFENKFTGYRESSLPITITSNALDYSVLINSSPLVDNGGIIKTGAGWRTLVTVSLTVKMGYNIAYAEHVKTEIKRFGADDSTYVEVELSNISGGIASATTQSQEDGEKHARAGIQNTGRTMSFQIYYPFESAYDANTKSLLLEFFRRIEDKDYNPSKKYTVRKTYPDFTVVNDWLYVGGVPTETKGVELGATVSLAPLR